MLHEQIKNKIKEAMMAKDAVLLKTLRGMVAAFMNEVMAKGKKPNEMLTDEEVIVVITRLAKQRKDSIEQFKKGNREDLVKEEEAEQKQRLGKERPAHNSRFREQGKRLCDQRKGILSF